MYPQKSTKPRGEDDNQAEGKINVFGMHGIGTQLGNEMKKLLNKEGLWVASMDEVWEYYYLKKFTRLNVSKDATGTNIQVIIPQYADHQFRDITLKLDATDVSDVTFSSNVVTSGWRQNDGYCTINVGLETRMYKYITEYLNLVNKYRSNKCIRRDLEYLLNLLAENEYKAKYQTLYNNLK